MNILYLDPYTDTPYSKRYLYYEGLYNSLIKRHDVFLFRKVIKDYKENPSEMSGSVTQVHENSPLLDEKNLDFNT